MPVRIAPSSLNPGFPGNHLGAPVRINASSFSARVICPRVPLQSSLNRYFLTCLSFNIIIYWKLYLSFSIWLLSKVENSSNFAR